MILIDVIENHAQFVLNILVVLSLSHLLTFQETIKALSGKGDPLKNFFYFDTADGKGVIEDISNQSANSADGKAVRVEVANISEC